MYSEVYARVWVLDRVQVQKAGGSRGFAPTLIPMRYVNKCSVINFGDQNFLLSFCSSIFSRVG
jgi:hypothetical protein